MMALFRCSPASHWTKWPQSRRRKEADRLEDDLGHAVELRVEDVVGGPKRIIVGVGFGAAIALGSLRADSLKALS
jgi:hypothetical protein